MSRILNVRTSLVILANAAVWLGATFVLAGARDPADNNLVGLLLGGLAFSLWCVTIETRRWGCRSTTRWARAYTAWGFTAYVAIVLTRDNVWLGALSLVLVVAAIVTSVFNERPTTGGHDAAVDRSKLLWLATLVTVVGSLITGSGISLGYVASESSGTYLAAAIDSVVLLLLYAIVPITMIGLAVLALALKPHTSPVRFAGFVSISWVAPLFVATWGTWPLPYMGVVVAGVACQWALVRSSWTPSVLEYR